MLTLDINACRDALKKTFSDHGGMELLKAIIEGAVPENRGLDPGPTHGASVAGVGQCHWR